MFSGFNEYLNYFIAAFVEIQNVSAVYLDLL